MLKETNLDYFGESLKISKILASKSFPSISQSFLQIRPNVIRSELAKLRKDLDRPTFRYRVVKPKKAEPYSISKSKKGEPSKYYSPYNCISKIDLYGLCETEAKLDELFHELVRSNYIDIYGNILEKFLNIKTPQALELPPQFTSLKNHLYKTLGSAAIERNQRYRTSGGIDKLQIEAGDIKNLPHKYLDFDEKYAYIGVLLKRRIWASKRNPQELEKWEQDKLWERMPSPPIKHFICFRKGKKLPHIISQESFDPKLLQYYLTRKIETTYLRWRHSDILNFLDGKTHVDALRLYKDIVSAYRRYCYFESEDTYYLLPLWVMGTYLFPLFSEYPLILLNGPHGSGKSRTSTVSACMAFNAQHLTDPNNAVIFRLAEKERASLFFDNAEWFSGKKETRLLSTLKSSYKRTANVPRVGQNTDDSINKYEIYSPKMFNNIEGVDHVMASRTIIIPQSFAPKGVKLDKHDPNEADPQWAEIRNRLYLFTFNYWQDIKRLLPEQAKLPIHGRQYELYCGILSIAQFLNKGLHKRIFQVAVKDAEERKSEYLKSNPEALTIQTLLTLVSADDYYLVSDIASGIKQSSDTPEAITTEWTGKILRSLGFGKKGEWRRLRETDGTRPTKYLIKRSVVLELAKRRGIQE